MSFRLNAWYVGVLVLVFSGAAVGGRLAARRSVENEHRAVLITELELHRSRLAASGLHQLQEFVMLRRQQSSLSWFVVVTDRMGRPLFEDLGHGPLLRLDELRGKSVKSGEVSRLHAGGRPWGLIRAEVGRFVVQIGVDDRPRLAALALVERIVWPLFALGILLGGAGGLLVTRRGLAPLHELIETSRGIVESNDLQTRVPVSGRDDELGELAVLLNRVLDRNQRLVDAMRESLDNVAHDLKTPLSRLRSGAELALERERTAAELREALADCVEESERAMGMLQTLMDISEAEAGVMQLALECVDLNSVAREVVELYRYVAEDASLDLSVQSDEAVLVIADRRRLTQAIANLVDNAIKYSEPGGTVMLRVRGEGNEACLLVADGGIGIDAAHIDKIWQRLYRADKSRSRRGLGLGLSLVKAVLEAHGGRASVESTPGKGSVFTICLRRAATHQVGERAHRSPREPEA